jgi:hypothetical protein
MGFLIVVFPANTTHLIKFLPPDEAGLPRLADRAWGVY